VKAFASGILSALGHSPTFAVRDFQAETRIASGALESAPLSLIVRSDSLALTDNVSEKDRREIERAMREEVLETSRYPEIAYSGTLASAEKVYEGRYRVRISGKLTLHGVSRELPLEAQMTWSDDRLRAQGEVPLKQSDFRIRPVSAAAGTIKLRDELKLAFDLALSKG
jgi:polyisoprenoid-binding protein YceI